MAIEVESITQLTDDELDHIHANAKQLQRCNIQINRTVYSSRPSALRVNDEGREEPNFEWT